MEDAPRHEMREAAPERHYDLPPPRPAPVETDFASSNEPAWSPPEPSYRDEPRPTQEPAREVSSSDSVPVSSDERQAS